MTVRQKNALRARAVPDPQLWEVGALPVLTPHQKFVLFDGPRAVVPDGQ